MSSREVVNAQRATERLYGRSKVGVRERERIMAANYASAAQEFEEMRAALSATAQRLRVFRRVALFGTPAALVVGVAIGWLAF